MRRFELGHCGLLLQPWVLKLTEELVQLAGWIIQDIWLCSKPDGIIQNILDQATVSKAIKANT